MFEALWILEYSSSTAACHLISCMYEWPLLCRHLIKDSVVLKENYMCATVYMKRTERDWWCFSMENWRVLMVIIWVTTTWTIFIFQLRYILRFHNYEREQRISVACTITFRCGEINMVDGLFWRRSQMVII